MPAVLNAIDETIQLNKKTPELPASNFTVTDDEGTILQTQCISKAAWENVLAQALQLKPRQQQLLIEALTGKEFQPPREWFRGRIVATNQPFNPRSKEYEWLEKHRYEYVGQWLALKDDQLLAYGSNAKEIFDKVRELGHEDAYVVYVEDPNLPFMNV